VYSRKYFSKRTYENIVSTKVSIETMEGTDFVQFTLKNIDFVEEEYDRSTKDPLLVDNILEQNETLRHSLLQKRKEKVKNRKSIRTVIWWNLIELDRIR
jgi:hypothetical protein